MGTLGMNARMELTKLALMSGPALSYQLMMMGGGLLIVAAVLLGLQRKTRVTLENSLLRPELMIYLARIANALERMEGPKSGEVAADVLRRLTSARQSGKVREMPKYRSK